ncbi:hypothetical protein IAT38_003302 [Cryptococcus sp. DSM 104549]
MSPPSTTLLAVLAALAMSGSALADPDHWILTHAQTLMIGRLDPIVNPGAISTHVHNVVGASNFGWNLNDPETQTSATCSSTIVSDDMSNYWAPELYYQYSNGTFSPILSATRIYYFTKGQEVKPFPPGLEMITGMAGTKDLSNTKAAGVRISCDHGEETAWLPNGTSHSGGCSTIAMGTYFPSCGLADGSVTSDDHFSHMAWPQSYNGTVLVDDVNGQYCPDSHPINYPTIFAQFNYYLNDDQPWRNDECTLILANGDCSGNTYHADFHNGWKQSTLQAAINKCGDGNGPGEDLMACAPLAATTSESATWDCRLEGPIPAEEVGLWRPIDALPGCNPVWKSGVPDKPTCDQTLEEPGMVGPNVYFANQVYRTHIPMALTEVQNASALTGLIPAVGNTGDSKLRQWGTDGVNVKSQTVGTYAEIVAKVAGGSAVGVDDSSSSSSGSSSSTAASSSATSTSSPGFASESATDSSTGSASGSATDSSTGSASGSAWATDSSSGSASGSASATDSSSGSATDSSSSSETGVQSTTDSASSTDAATDSSSASASAAATTAPVGVAAVVTGDAADTDSASSATSAASVSDAVQTAGNSLPKGKTCRRRKRNALGARSEAVKSHLSRRSRRDMLR